ncbi:MAG: hypothetical protein R2875_10920 [Desulfobacterales bacterium]
MYCIYFALVCFVCGIGVWMAGSVVEKRKKTAARGLRKKYQRLSDRLAWLPGYCLSCAQSPSSSSSFCSSGPSPQTCSLYNPIRGFRKPLSPASPQGAER